MDSSKWSYLAGLFDGEGCVSIASRPHHTVDKRNGREVTWKRTSMQISIANTNLSLMKWLVANFGGVYYSMTPQDERCKPRYSWQPKGAKNRENFLLGILPYLVIKREQVQLGLEYVRLPLTAVAQRDAIVARCGLLNQKGKSVTTNTLDSAQTAEKIESDLAGDCECASLVTANA